LKKEQKKERLKSKQKFKRFINFIFIFKIKIL